MKLYVAGAISSDPDYVAHFAAGAEAVRQAGHEPALPPNLQPDGYDHEAFMQEHKGATPMVVLREYLKVDLLCLLDCDGIALLPTWLNSTGAKVERGVAMGVGLPVFFITNDYIKLRSLDDVSVEYANV